MNQTKAEDYAQTLKEDAIYQAGIDAFKAGMGEEGCPYPAGDACEDGRIWFAGFDDAKASA